MKDIVVEFEVDSAKAEKHLKNTMKVMKDIKKSMQQLSKLSKTGFADLSKSADRLHGFFTAIQKMGVDLEKLGGKAADLGKAFENVSKYGKVFADSFKVAGAIAEITGLDKHLQEFLGKNTKACSTFNSEYVDLSNNLMGAFSGLGSSLNDLSKDLEDVGGKLGNFGTKLKTVGQIGQAFAIGWDIGRAIAEAFNLDPIMEKFWLWLFDLPERIGSAVHDAFAKVKEKISAFFEEVVNIGKIFLDLLKSIFVDPWINAYNLIRDAVSTGSDAVRGMISSFIEAIKKIGSKVLQFLKMLFVDPWVIAYNDIIATVGMIRDGVSNIISEVIDAFTNFKNNISETVDNIRNKVTEVFSAVIDTFCNLKDSVVKTVSNLRDKVSEIFSKITGFFTDLKNTASETIESVKKTFQELIDKMINIGKDIIDNLIKGLTKKWTEAKDWVQGKVNEIREMFQYKSSPAFYCFFNYGQLIIDNLSAGMESKAPELYDTIKGITATASALLQDSTTSGSASGLILPSFSKFLAKGKVGDMAAYDTSKQYEEIAPPSAELDDYEIDYPEKAPEPVKQGFFGGLKQSFTSGLSDMLGSFGIGKGEGILGNLFGGKGTGGGLFGLLGSFAGPQGGILGTIQQFASMIPGIGGMISNIIGGIGTAFNALKSLFGGLSEEEKVAKDVTRDLGVSISDDLAKKIADSSKEIGDRFTAVIVGPVV
jgi:ABC-type transporter Mla subunit MlaD